VWGNAADALRRASKGSAADSRPDVRDRSRSKDADSHDPARRLRAGEVRGSQSRLIQSRDPASGSSARVGDGSRLSKEVWSHGAAVERPGHRVP
jgi:hypothetical protein